MSDGETRTKIRDLTAKYIEDVRGLLSEKDAMIEWDVDEEGTLLWSLISGRYEDVIEGAMDV